MLWKLIRAIFRNRSAGRTPALRRRTPFVITPDEVHQFRKFPEPRWDLIFARIDACPREFSAHDYTCDAIEQWLELLAASLGADYDVYESDHCFAVHPTDTGEAAIRFIEVASVEVRNVLGPLAWQPNAGKHVVIGFKHLRDYYTYISAYYPEVGNFGLSVGICVRDTGYTHVAYVAGWDDRNTISHELVHYLLSHREVPLWIEEGLAQMIAARVSGGADPVFGPEPMGQLYRCWRREGLSDFWSGRSFAEEGDVQRHSYALAYLLVLKIVERHNRYLVRFIEHASREDAGEVAAATAFGKGLGTLVAEILGEGDWTPNAAGIRASLDKPWEQPAIGQRDNN